MKNTVLLRLKNELQCFSGPGVLGQWASIRANPQAYGPLGSTHSGPRTLAGRWRSSPAPRPSLLWPGAIARAKTWCPPPAGCNPQSRGTESQALPSFHLHKARKRGGVSGVSPLSISIKRGREGVGALSPPKGGTEGHEHGGVVCVKLLSVSHARRRKNSKKRARATFGPCGQSSPPSSTVLRDLRLAAHRRAAGLRPPSSRLAETSLCVCETACSGMLSSCLAI